MESLTEFQEGNCRGCFYADEEKVGSGLACCTYPHLIKLEKGQCRSKRNEKGPPTCPDGDPLTKGINAQRKQNPSCLPVIIPSLRAIVNNKEARPDVVTPKLE